MGNDCNDCDELSRILLAVSSVAVLAAVGVFALAFRQLRIAQRIAQRTIAAAEVVNRRAQILNASGAALVEADPDPRSTVLPPPGV